jgi:hypothetical protein
MRAGLAATSELCQPRYKGSAGAVGVVTSLLRTVGVCISKENYLNFTEPSRKSPNSSPKPSISD